MENDYSNSVIILELYNLRNVPETAELIGKNKTISATDIVWKSGKQKRYMKKECKKSINFVETS